MRGAFAGLVDDHVPGRRWPEPSSRAAASPCATSPTGSRHWAWTRREIRVVGGGARSREWLQVKADVTGRPVRAVQVEEATALGAALLAAVACGTFADLDQAVKACVVTADEPIRPRAEPRRAVYADAYGRYRALFDGVEGALA